MFGLILLKMIVVHPWIPPETGNQKALSSCCAELLRGLFELKVCAILVHFLLWVLCEAVAFEAETACCVELLRGYVNVK